MDSDISRDAQEIQAAKALVAADYVALRPLQQSPAAGSTRSPLKSEVAAAFGSTQPCLVTGTWDELNPLEPVLLNSRALTDWDLDKLGLPGLLAVCPDKLLVLRGTDDDGEPVRVTCRAFIHYMMAQDELDDADEEPLCAFDAEVLYDCQELCSFYTVPDIRRLQLRAGLLERLPIVLQPPLRWLILGPTRTGSGIHQDPPGTCAWNVVTHGCKRWAMLSPDVPAELALRDSSKTMADWFEHEWPGICAEASAAGYAALDFDQRKGELVYIPSGWWHAALNVEGSVAITHNFLQGDNLRKVIETTGVGADPLVTSGSVVDEVVDVLKLCRDRGRLTEPVDDGGEVLQWLLSLQEEGVIALGPGIAKTSFQGVSSGSQDAQENTSEAAQTTTSNYQLREDMLAEFESMRGDMMEAFDVMRGTMDQHTT